MSEIVMQVLIRDVTIDNILDYYGNSFYCGNCRKSNHRYILKGRKIADQSFLCDYCGCVINEKTKPPLTKQV